MAFDSPKPTEKDTEEEGIHFGGYVYVKSPNDIMDIFCWLLDNRIMFHEIEDTQESLFYLLINEDDALKFKLRWV